MGSEGRGVERSGLGLVVLGAGGAGLWGSAEDDWGGGLRSRLLFFCPAILVQEMEPEPNHKLPIHELYLAKLEDMIAMKK